MTGRNGPIFIGGLSHSGKTPLRMVLGAHPEISMTRKVYLWDRFYGRFGDLGDTRNLDRCLAAMLGDAAVHRLEPDPARIRGELLQSPPTYARLFTLLHHQHAARMGARRWGEQLGFIERFADPIFDEVPAARMIHMIRDPRARSAASGTTVRRRSGKLGWETAMWLRSADLAERNGRRYAGRYRVVTYEALAAWPTETVQEVCDFLGEEFVPAMAEVVAGLQFDGNRIGGPGRSDGTRPVRISATEAAFVDRYAGRELSLFGYATGGATLSPREQMTFALVDRPVNRTAMAAWRVLERRATAGQVRG